MTHRAHFLLALFLLTLPLAGCAAGGKPGRPAEAGWREIATESDRQRLREWRTAWVEALRKAGVAGKGAEIAREGALLRPDAAIAFQAPPAGDYACRIVKIGAKSEGLLDYIAYPSFLCRIQEEDGALRLDKLTGSQRPGGRLFPTVGNRMIFLGTLQLGDERTVFHYGQDRERDVAGILEQIEERRWRLALPYPHFESTIDIVELVPRTANP